MQEGGRKQSIVENTFEVVCESGRSVLVHQQAMQDIAKVKLPTSMKTLYSTLPGLSTTSREFLSQS